MNTPSIWKFRATLLAAFLAVAPFSPSLHAQRQEMEVKVNVPFAFESGSQHYTAGVYSIRRENGRIMLIQGTSEAGLVVTQLTEDSRPAEKDKAVFHKYGSQYFLSEIWVVGKSEHVRFLESKAERRLQIAANNTAPVGVELALLEMPR